MFFLNKKSNTKYLDCNEVPAQNRKYSVISLFTGAGGLDIGLEESGFTTEVCIEYDDDCRETLKFNRKDWKLFDSDTKIVRGKEKKRIPGDIRAISVTELLKFSNLKKGNIDLVVGGAPCQPFSNIGKKLGKNDQKNGDLFLEFVRMVKGLKPKAFLFENVVGITQEKHSDVIEYMINKFKGLGYGITYSILNSANYGVPQRRERFFMLGIKGIDEPAFPLPTHWKDVKHYNSFISELDTTPSCIQYKKWNSVYDAFKSLDDNFVNRPDYAIMNISDMVKTRMTYIRQGENFKVLPLDLRPNCWKEGKHQGNDTFGRMIGELPSCTIRTAAYNPAKGQYIHPTEDRGLSTVEMAALQTFPYTWVFKCKGNKKMTLVSGGKQIGNAVPPLLAKYIGLAIKKQLQLR